MINELWWAIPKKLAGMRKPANSSDVMSLKENVTAIISLLDDKENHDLYQEANMPFLWLPIKGGGTPTPEQVKQARDFYKTCTSNSNGAVAIHCSGGRKRTGTLIAAILTNDMHPSYALDTIKSANPEVILSESQTAFIHSLIS